MKQSPAWNGKRDLGSEAPKVFPGRKNLLTPSACGDPLTPRRTGYLIKSGQLGTVIGSGVLEYTAPYARRQYYENAGKSGGNRGKLWFERMKAKDKEDILKGAKKYARS